MPLSQIINKYPNVQMTETTGTVERVEINERTGKPRHRIETTWCHSKEYFRIRNRTNVDLDYDAGDHTASRHNDPLRKALANLSADERELIIGILKGE